MSLIHDLVPHMRRVQAADRDLHDLSLLWQMIEASSAISCPEEAESILPTLSETRVRFDDLQQRLVNQLASENLAELGDELASVGQCTIDILVRNLFERTADVGFLATDDVLRDFCAADPDTRAARRDGFRRRLAEYRAKYTVYDDIIVLDPEGSVLARLSDGGPAVTTDPVVAQAVGAHGFAERYGATDLADDGQPALLYGHRIDDAGGHCLGVLVLRFRIVDELQRIFASVSADRGEVAVVLIDDQGRVIVSNNESHIALGARLQTGRDGEVEVSIFGGREYLSVTCETRGYQGYMGPGWRAQAMVSLLTAFRGGHEGAGGDEQVVLDNEELHRIQSEVDAINRNLRRVVWNGRLMASGRGQTSRSGQARLKAVLHQVNQAGTRTRDRVAVAIRDLYHTSLGRSGHQARELARLAADIMDRNLYERANDCRWWALSPVIQRVMAEPASAEGTRELNHVLDTINALYTVYTRLVTFDLGGVIRGASNDDSAHTVVGDAVEPGWVQAVQSLSDSQRYAVSEFAPCALYDGAPTYVYLAAVRGGEGQPVVGGIAIVFHAAREFRAMLDDVLDGRNGLAAFIDGQGRVIASTDDRQGIGQPLSLDTDANIVEHDDAHHAVAQCVAGGYREFKVSDGYANGVRAVVALRLGALERRRASAADIALRALPTQKPAERQEYALFQVASGRFALPAGQVLEARALRGLVRAPGGLPAVAGLLEVPDPQGARVVPVLCSRSLMGVDTPPRATDGVVLVLSLAEGGRAAFGLRVDEVLTVAEVGPEHRQPAPGGLAAGTAMLNALLRLSTEGPQAQDVLVQLLDAQAMARAAGLQVNVGASLQPA